MRQMVLQSIIIFALLGLAIQVISGIWRWGGFCALGYALRVILCGILCGVKLCTAAAGAGAAGAAARGLAGGAIGATDTAFATHFCLDYICHGTAYYKHDGNQDNDVNWFHNVILCCQF